MTPRRPGPDFTPSGVQGRNLAQTIPGFDVIGLTGHAVEQMGIRGVSDQEVLDTLREPHETGLPTMPAHRKRVRRSMNARFWVDVVYEELGPMLRVITVIKVFKTPIRRRRRP